jgi:predicted nucleic acid-binding Zn ribbon protein
VTRAKYLKYGRRNEPEEISDVLGAIIERASGSIDIRQGELIQRWDDIVPGDWVDVATPIGIREKSLLVEVEDGTAGSLLKYQSQQLIDAVAEEFGDDLVTSVRLRVVST